MTATDLTLAIAAVQSVVAAHGTDTVLAALATIVRAHVASVVALQAEARAAARPTAKTTSAPTGDRAAPVRLPQELRPALAILRAADAKVHERVYYEIVLRANRAAAKVGSPRMAAVSASLARYMERAIASLSPEAAAAVGGLLTAVSTLAMDEASPVAEPAPVAADPEPVAEPAPVAADPEPVAEPAPVAADPEPVAAELPYPRWAVQTKKAGVLVVQAVSAEDARAQVNALHGLHPKQIIAVTLFAASPAPKKAAKRASKKVA